MVSDNLTMTHRTLHSILWNHLKNSLVFITLFYFCILDSPFLGNLPSVIPIIQTSLIFLTTAEHSLLKYFGNSTGSHSKGCSICELTTSSEAQSNRRTEQRLTRSISRQLKKMEEESDAHSMGQPPCVSQKAPKASPSSINDGSHILAFTWRKPTSACWFKTNEGGNEYTLRRHASSPLKTPTSATRFYLSRAPWAKGPLYQGHTHASSAPWHSRLLWHVLQP